MLGCVVNGEACYMVDKDCPNAFSYCGGWYIHFKDYPIAKAYYEAKNL